jgi:hypothetical protein
MYVRLGVVIFPQRLLPVVLSTTVVVVAATTLRIYYSSKPWRHSTIVQYATSLCLRCDIVRRPLVRERRSTHSSPIPTNDAEERTLSVTLVIRAAERSSIPLIQGRVTASFSNTHFRFHPWIAYATVKHETKYIVHCTREVI